MDVQPASLAGPLCLACFALQMQLLGVAGLCGMLAGIDCVTDYTPVLVYGRTHSICDTLSLLRQTHGPWWVAADGHTAYRAGNINICAAAVWCIYVWRSGATVCTTLWQVPA